MNGEGGWLEVVRLAAEPCRLLTFLHHDLLTTQSQL